MRSVRAYLSVEEVDQAIPDVLKIRLAELRKHLPEGDMIEITVFKFRSDGE